MSANIRQEGERAAPSDLLTVTEVAARLRFSISHVRELALKGDLPAVRIGRLGHWRFRASDIEAIVAGEAREDP